MYTTLIWTSKRFPKICKRLVVYRFYCMALFHSQTLRHMIMVFITSTWLRLSSAFLQSCQSFCFLHTQSMDVDKDSDPNIHLLQCWKSQHMCLLALWTFALSTKNLHERETSLHLFIAKKVQTSLHIWAV